MLSTALIAAPRPAAGDPLASARDQAAQITTQLQSDSARLDIVSQQYEEAQARVQQLNSQIQQIRTTITTDEVQVQSDGVTLRRQAIATYISNGDASDISSLFASGNNESAVADQYSAVANTDVSNAIDNLDIAKQTLSAQEQQLQSAQSEAQVSLDAAASAQQAAQVLVSQQQTLLGEVKGQIATLVARQEAARQAAEQAAFVARPSPARPAIADAQRVAASSLPPASGASGAVQAAESQIGVPYQWGAEDPGVGFDCSGLTQWSWRQAGVGIPRTAQDQYDAIAHVSLSDLEPGDLLFWGYGTGDIYHVAMYVGNGDVVQAPQTGEDVQIDPIWQSDLVGAGRP